MGEGFVFYHLSRHIPTLHKSTQDSIALAWSQSMAAVEETDGPALLEVTICPQPILADSFHSLEASKSFSKLLWFTV